MTYNAFILSARTADDISGDLQRQANYFKLAVPVGSDCICFEDAKTIPPRYVVAIHKEHSQCRLWPEARCLIEFADFLSNGYHPSELGLEVYHKGLRPNLGDMRWRRNVLDPEEIFGGELPELRIG